MQRRTLLKGGIVAGVSPWLPSVSTAQHSPAVTYGWNRAVRAPTQAHFYVALEGDDNNDGSFAAPFRSIQRGVDMLARREGGSLAIRGGIYREAVSLDALRGTAAAPYHLHRYGDEPVTISAADPITGWQSVTTQEADRLGAEAVGLYKVTLAASQLAHGSALALNLHENGIWCPPTSQRADMQDPAAYNQSDTFLTGRFTVNTDDHIMEVQDDRLVGLGAAQMQDVQVLLFHRPNLVSSQPIAGFDPATGTITLSQQNRRLQRSGEQPVMRYGLLNVSWTRARGTCFTREHSPGEITIYYRPRTAGPSLQGMEVSTRSHCLDLGRSEHLTLQGLNAIRAAGVSRFDGLCIRRNDMGHRATGLRIEDCRAGENLSGAARGYGAIFLRNTRGLTLRSLTIEHARNSFGLSVFDAQTADMRHLYARNVSQSPGRFYTLRNSILAFSLFEDSAQDNHANKFNFYEGCDNVLVYGIRTRGVKGYATFQEASRIHFAFCALEGDADASGRALVSQNRRPGGSDQGGADGTGEPVAGGTSYLWNNTLLPDPQDPSKANALSLGPGGTSQRYVVLNNVIHGGGFIDIYRNNADPSGETRAHNLYTGLSFWQTARSGWHLGHAEAETRPNRRVQASGFDMRPIIDSQLSEQFPGFADWDRDIDGQPIDWDTPPVGCQIL